MPEELSVVTALLSLRRPRRCLDACSAWSEVLSHRWFVVTALVFSASGLRPTAFFAQPVLGPVLLLILLLRSSAHRAWDSDRRCCGRTSDVLGLYLTPLVVDVLTFEVLSSKIGFDP